MSKTTPKPSPSFLGAFFKGSSNHISDLWKEMIQNSHTFPEKLSKLKKEQAVQFIQSQYESLDEWALSPLLYAIKSDFKEATQAILQAYQTHSIDINQQDSKLGYTILHYAICWPSPKSLSLLLKFPGIKASLTNHDQNTPLHFFCSKYPSPNCHELFQLLLDRGADPNFQNNQGETPLHSAVFNSTVRLIMAELLLEAGCDVNICSNRSKTVLHYSIELGREDLFLKLVRFDADLLIEDNQHRNALQLAVELKQTNIVTVIDQLLELQAWLNSLGLSKYYSIFITQGLGKEHIGELEPIELTHMGVSPPDVSKILKSLGKKVDPNKIPKLSARFGTLTKLGQRNNKVQTRGTLQLVNAADLEYTAKIGSGANSKVYQALYKSQLTVAVKIIKGGDQESIFEEVRRELQIVALLNHPNIISLFGVVLDRKIGVVMEYCPFGSVLTLMQKPEFDLDWETFFQFALDISSGLKYLHSCNAVHRDIKTSNLLVDESGVIKLSDFGLSRTMDSANFSTLNRLRGTSLYVAPEVILAKGSTPKSDVYSFSIVLWELAQRCLTGVYERPFSDSPDLIFDYMIMSKVSQNGKRPTLHPNTPKPLLDLIVRSWAQQPSDRPDSASLNSELTSLMLKLQENPSDWNSSRQSRLSISTPKLEELFTKNE